MATGRMVLPGMPIVPGSLGVSSVVDYPIIPPEYIEHGKFLFTPVTTRLGAVSLARVLHSLRHPNLLHCFGVIENSGPVDGPFGVLVLERVVGPGTISDLCLQGDSHYDIVVKSSSAIRVLLGVALGLHYLHMHGFVHGHLDLKCVHVDENWCAKLELQQPPSTITLAGVESDLHAFSIIALALLSRDSDTMAIPMWIPIPLDSILEACKTGNGSLQEIITTLGYVSSLDAATLLNYMDIPRIRSFLGTHVVKLHELAIQELFECSIAASKHCSRCFADWDAPSFSGILVESGFLPILATLLKDPSKDIQRHCIRILSHIVTEKRLTKTYEDTKHLLKSVISTPGALPSIITLAKDINRDVARASKAFLLAITGYSDLLMCMVKDLSTPSLCAFIRQVRADVLQTEANLQVITTSLESKKKCLEMSVSNLSDTGTSSLEWEDRYTVRTEIGQGQSSSVYFVRDKFTNEGFALKKIDISPSIDFPRLEQEYNILAGISHPNIVAVEDYFVSGTSVVIVMEVVSSGDLFEYILSHGKLDEATACRFSREVLDALMYLHSFDLLHRDIKLDNILLHEPVEGGTLCTKLADFGFSRVIDSEPPLSMLAKPSLKRAISELGTMGFVAPEIVTGCGYGKAAELWSLGVAIHIMLTGYPPYCPQAITDFKSGYISRPFWMYFDEMEIPSLLTESQSPGKSCLVIDPGMWSGVSYSAMCMVRSLLHINPDLRPTAQSTLEFGWFGKQLEGLPTPKKLSSSCMRVHMDTIGPVICRSLSKLSNRG